MEYESWQVGNIPVCACVSAGEIVCEPPNNHLNKFEGVLNWKDEKFALDNEKLLLRGCVLRNTGWCFGLVIFAGKDTKLMMNSGQTTFKRTHIDQLMNVLIVGVRVCCILFDALYYRVAFSDLTVLAWCQEGHPACKNCMVGCWRGCLEWGADCLHMWSSWCIPKPNHLLPHLNPDWFYLSYAGLPRFPGWEAIERV